VYVKQASARGTWYRAADGTRMSDFGRELTRLMAERGAGVRQVARALYVNPGHLSNLRNGNANPSAELADALDRHPGGGGGWPGSRGHRRLGGHGDRGAVHRARWKRCKSL
jgi:hypothetical protein